MRQPNGHEEFLTNYLQRTATETNEYLLGHMKSEIYEWLIETNIDLDVRVVVVACDFWEISNVC